MLLSLATLCTLQWQQLFGILRTLPFVNHNGNTYLTQIGSMINRVGKDIWGMDRYQYRADSNDLDGGLALLVKIFQTFIDSIPNNQGFSEKRHV